jgi:peroxiredoxin
MNTATPLDSVYGVSASAVVTLDTRRGLPVRREAESRRDDGRGIARTRSVTTLDSVTAFDTAGFRPFAADLDQWFGAKRAFDDRTDELQRRDDTNPARWHVAESLLAEAASAVRDSVVRRLFDEELASYREAAGPMLEELRGRLGRLGKPAPDWTLADLDGKEYRLKQFLGRVVVLDFWYRACPWCIRAMPALDALAREFRGKGVVVLGMNTDESLGDARFVVDRLHLSYPSLRCGDLAKKYGVTGFPTLFVIDRRGRISDIRVGFEPDMAERLRRSIRRALGEE